MGESSRRQDHRRHVHLAGAGPFHVRVHQTLRARQSVSDTFEVMSMTPDRWRQIEDLYHAARERGPAERVALLERTDPDIRARVERMLAMDSAGQILDQSAGGLGAGPPKTVIATGPPLGTSRIGAQTRPRR